MMFIVILGICGVFDNNDSVEVQIMVIIQNVPLVQMVKDVVPVVKKQVMEM